MLELNHVHKSFADRGRVMPVLDDIHVRIPDGQFVCIVGPSGSGKSTLLRIMMGLAAPSSRSVLYQGQPVLGVNLRAAHGAGQCRAGAQGARACG